MVACTDAELTVSTGPFAGTLGHGGFSVTLNNHSTTSCTLTGYPGVDALTATGQQAVQASRTLRGYQGGLPTGGNTPPVVTLEPGRSAVAGVEWIEVPTGSQTSCPSYPAILVTPPNTTGPTRLPAPHLYLCRDLEVHPVTSTSGPGH